MSNFECVITPPGGGNVPARILLAADIGSQVFSPITGNPIDATEGGVVELMVVDGKGGRAVIAFTDLTFAAAVRDALDRAIKVADTRDYNLDKPRTNA